MEIISNENRLGVSTTHMDRPEIRRCPHRVLPVPIFEVAAIAIVFVIAWTLGAQVGKLFALI